MWFRRWFRPESVRSEGLPSTNGRLTFELDHELAAQLQLAARARAQSPERLAADLLARGLEREALRARAEAALAFLTPREQEVARLTARGYTNHQIAEALFISPETVKTHVRRVLEKFTLHSKADLRLLLLDLGIRWWEGETHTQ